MNIMLRKYHYYKKAHIDNSVNNMKDSFMLAKKELDKLHNDVNSLYRSLISWIYNWTLIYSIR